jgi:hypothetical protein
MNPSSANAAVSIEQFQVELRRIARFIPAIAMPDPLTAIVDTIVEHPAYTESRLLARLLAALTYQRGEFRLAEGAVFSSSTLALIIGLLDGLGRGNISEAQCRRAVEMADAAQRTVAS